MINTIEYLPGIGSRDHVCLQFNLCYSTCTKATLPRYNLRQADVDKMKEYVLQEVYWNHVLTPLNIHST